MKLKKTLVFLLVLSMVLSAFAFACGKNTDEPEEPGTETDAPADDENAEDEEPADDETAERPTEPSGQLIIGTTTEMSGDFSGVWQNNASDADVRRLIQGYGTVDQTDEGEYVIDDSIVEKYETKDNEDGSKTYTFTIKQGLKFADGKEITAKNYVGNILFWSSKLIGPDFCQGKNTAGIDLVGYDAFSKGEKKEFEGVHLIDDYTFSSTINPENTPYFYELNSVSSGPEDLEFWLGKEVDIKDDGDGCYFVEDINTEEFKNAVKAARDRKTLPSSGPYMLEKYDEAQQLATMVINPNFQGDRVGRKPLISKVILKKITQATQIDDLKTGGVDIIKNIGDGKTINAGMDLTEDEGFAYTDYPRAGYGKIAFSCDVGPTQFPEVRQALAYLLDRNDFAKQFTGGYGSVVNGPYGTAQWFYQETSKELDEKLNSYPYDPAKAVELLEKVGFTLNESGAEYKEGDGIRYKKMDDGKLMPLEIKWASTENNEVSDLLVVKLAENPDLVKAGIKIQRDAMSFDELLNWLYRDASQDAKYGVPTYNMFNLASGFTPWYDRKYDYSTKEEMIKMGYNTNFIFDKELEQAAIDMVKCTPDQRDVFKENFVKFIVRWNEMLPDLPLYSNQYHDFYNSKLKHWVTSEMKGLTATVLDAWVTE
ncbi:ABC transporter substrate-binding protein [uncultured Fenollaria sp.]|uniref:ABC transporter substrate-binding protein n=1 Tax=uncultured Fenollaria sp. TaxID=1686315 RepID=UPI0025F4AE26|nr:ABC transporter substrate-binding protein [uncultured Fenollaria sp.]